MEQLSEHFTLEEFEHSDTAKRLNMINHVPDELLPNAIHTAQCMEKVRALLGHHPLTINSGYRCQELNLAVKGSATSDHMQAWAVDFVCPAFGIPLDIVHAIEKSGIEFDQCIQEGTWVHISFNPLNRRRVMTAHFDVAGNATYTKGA